MFTTNCFRFPINIELNHPPSYHFNDDAIDSLNFPYEKYSITPGIALVKYKCEVNGFQTSKDFVFTAIHIVSFEFFNSFLLLVRVSIHFGKLIKHWKWRKTITWKHLMGIFNEMKISSNAIIHFILFAFHRLLNRLSDYWLSTGYTDSSKRLECAMCMSQTAEHEKKSERMLRLMIQCH